MVTMIPALISATRMFVMASASPMTTLITMTPASGEKYTPAGGKQGDDGKHKQQIFHMLNDSTY